MNNVNMVEDCSTITPKEVFGILRQENKKKTSAKHSDISCWLDDPNDQDVIWLSAKGSEPQKIVFEWRDINFGRVAFFKCNCDQRCSKMYLPPNGSQYKCRKCHALKYRLSSLNPKSKAGQMIYKLNKMNKLIETRANISHIHYRGQYTKRFNRFLADCKDAGLNDVVEKAQDFLDTIKVQ